VGGLLPHLLEGTYSTPADPLAGFFGKGKGGKEMRRGRVRKKGERRGDEVKERGAKEESQSKNKEREKGEGKGDGEGKEKDGKAGRSLPYPYLKVGACGSGGVNWGLVRVALARTSNRSRMTLI